MVTWGTSPQDVVDIDGIVPDPENEQNEDRKNSINRSLKYMGLKPKTKIKDIWSGSSAQLRSSKEVTKTFLGI